VGKVEEEEQITLAEMQNMVEEQEEGMVIL
jgi:hypothetical protein